MLATLNIWCVRARMSYSFIDPPKESDTSGDFYGINRLQWRCLQLTIRTELFLKNISLSAHSWKKKGCGELMSGGGGGAAFHLEFSHFSTAASSKRSTSIPPSSTLISSSSRPSPTCPHSSSLADWPLFQRGVRPRASAPSEGIPVMMKGWRSQEEGRGSSKRVWWAEVLMWNSTSKT